MMPKMIRIEITAFCYPTSSKTDMSKIANQGH